MLKLILVVIVSSMIFCIGGVMQKKGITSSFPPMSGAAFVREWKRILTTVLRNWMWVVGSGFCFVGFVLHFITVGMGDISLVQPLYNIQIVMIVFAGVVFLREKMRPVEYAGIAVLLAGALTISIVGGAAAEPALKGSRLVALSAVVYSFIAVVVLLLRRGNGGRSFEIALASITGLLVGMTAIFMKAAMVLVTSKYGGLAPAEPGFWLTVLTNPLFWLVFAHGMTSTVIVQWAFTRGRVAVLIPVINTVQLVIPVAAGIIVFSETVPAGRLVGIAIIFAGTMILNRGGE